LSASFPVNRLQCVGGRTPGPIAEEEARRVSVSKDAAGFLLDVVGDPSGKPFADAACGSASDLAVNADEKKPAARVSSSGFDGAEDPPPDKGRSTPRARSAAAPRP
jgi:hypothetical protein